ncbi:MAG TPA: polyprenyl synthetase family protein [Planctomycetota bacterium]|nr:polyprenyl synthetase family protein [Planctomycetota bacterium]
MTGSSGLQNLPRNSEERGAILLKIVAPILSDLARSEETLSKFLSSQYAYINTLVRHIERFKGKRLRPAVLHLSARAFGGEAPLACDVAALVEMIHLATLCHDDILDDAETRRNVPTVNANWGNKSAVMTGDILFSRAFEIMGRFDDPRPFRILSRTSRLICEGELLQIDSRFKVDLDEDAYFDLIEKKTAVLFGAAAELGALLAGAKESESKRMYAYGRRLGIAFQIVDDCLDLIGVEQTVGKSLGSDLKNGEPTLPIIHLFANTTGARKQELLNMFKPESGGPTREALRPYFDRAGSIDYAMQIARAEIQRARDEIDFLPPSGAKSALIEIPDYVLVRTS